MYKQGLSSGKRYFTASETFRFNLLDKRESVDEHIGSSNQKPGGTYFNDLLCAGLGHEYKHPGDVGSSAGILCHVFLLPA